jgi:DNA-binding NarL/FixJ family response regulator
MMSAPLRVFLLDDHELVRRGLKDLLEQEADLVVVGEAGTAAEAVTVALETRPDVAVLDVRLPDGSGIEVCRELRARLPEVACLMLTSFADDEALLASVMAGAAGYVVKQIRGEELLRSIRAVGEGKSLLDARSVGLLLARLQTPLRDDPFAALSSQEHRVLELVAEGLSNREIGAQLELAEKTVKNYVSSLLSKLGLQRRTQAAILVAQTRPRTSV